MIMLYGVPRSRTMRPLWMLEELGVPYENKPVSFLGESRSPEFLRLNPNGHIPVLRDDDVVIWESMAINLYLARKYGKGLWPRTVEDEGRAFQWSGGFLPEDQRDPKKADDAAERFKTPLGVLNGALAGKQYLLGDAFTVADLNVAAVLCWAFLAGLDLGKAPQAQAWLGRCTGRPAFERVQRMTS